MQFKTLGTLRTLSFALAVLAGIATTAQAVPIVRIVPETQNRLIGDLFSVDITVSDVTEAIGGLDITLDFDETILGGVSYAIGSAFGAGFDGSFGFSGGAGSPLNLYFASFSSIPTLVAAQGTAFTMATVNFLALADGVSPLTFSSVSLSDGAGTGLLASTSVGGRVCVGRACSVTTVPEPATMTLLGLGFIVSAFSRRRAARTSQP